MDKELIKKLVAQGKAYVLDLRGGSVPYVLALLTKVWKLMWPLLARTKHKLVT